MAASCELCGGAILQPRRGSQPKRFCSSACRGKAHRGKSKEPRRHQLSGSITPERRLADLEEIYEALMGEFRAEGPKAKAAIDRVLKVSVEIGRLAGPAVEAEPEDILSAVA